jgi:hypothetical protein
MKVLYPEITYGAIASSGKPSSALRLVKYRNTPLVLIPSALPTVFVSCHERSSSIQTAVTHAALSKSEYMDMIHQYAPSQCSDHLVSSIKTIDHILVGSNDILGGRRWAKWGLKKVFGLEGLSRDEDFAGVIEVSVRQGWGLASSFAHAASRHHTFLSLYLLC